MIRNTFTFATACTIYEHLSFTGKTIPQGIPQATIPIIQSEATFHYQPPNRDTSIPGCGYLPKGFISGNCAYLSGYWSKQEFPFLGLLREK